MLAFRVLTGFGSALDPWAMTTVLLPFMSGGRSLVLAGSGATGGYHLLDLTQGTARLAGSFDLGSVPIRDAALVGSETDGWLLYTVSSLSGRLQVQEVGSDGSLGTARILPQLAGLPGQIAVIEPIRLGSIDYLALAGRDKAGLTLVRILDDRGLQPVAGIEDGPKLTLSGVSDMVSLTVGAQIYLVSVSTERDGLSCFRVGPDGAMTLVDSLTAKDGLWVSGLDVVAVAEMGGQDFVLAGSTLVGSLSVLRINELGVLFITDQVHDDLSSRFGAVSQIATVTAGNRVLVVAGGGDGGLSLLELLPDGRLFHHAALEPREGSSALAGGLTGLDAVLSGNTLRILAGGADAVVQLAVPLTGFGPALLGTAGAETLRGGAADELIFGFGGADRLEGGAGDDLIVASTAGATMLGGPGEDIFRPGPGTAITRIRDFEHGIDRLDLGDWGRLYDMSALQIRSRPDGAEIRFGTAVLQLQTADGAALVPSSWAADDFLF